MALIAYRAPAEYVDMIRKLIVLDNPNKIRGHDDMDGFVEYDEQAIQDLANYLDANEYAERALQTEFPSLYTLYDLIKWTNANKEA